MSRRRLYIGCAVPAALALFLLLTVFFIPNDAIKGLLVRAADQRGLTLSLSGLSKGFPLALTARGVEVSSAQGALVRLDRVRVGLEILPLFVGKARLAVRGALGSGEIAGTVDLARHPGFTVKADGIRLEDIPFFRTVAGARVKGELRLTGDIAGGKELPSGKFRLEVRNVELSGVKVGPMPLPDASYKDVRGALAIGKGRADLTSLTLDGDGIYLRLKGEATLANPIGDSPLNLTLEMMPSPAFLEKQKFVFLLLTKYQTTPGTYRIPIHGTLGHPAV